MKRLVLLWLAAVLWACATSSTPPPPSATAPTPPPPPVATAPSAPAVAEKTVQPLPYLSQLPPLIDRDLLFGDPEIAGGQISPNGKFISFIKPYRGMMNIWVKGVDQSFSQARPVTADTKRPVGGYFWSRDSKYILYVQDKGGDENYHVYAVDPAAKAVADTGVPAARDLTPYEKTRAYIFAVPKKDPQHVVIGLNDRDPAHHDVYRVDLKTGRRILLMLNDQKVAGWEVDEAGKVRLGVRQTGDGGTEILRVDGKKLKQVYTCGFEESCNPMRYHRDQRRVYLQTNKGERDLTALVLFDPQTGKEELVDHDPENEVDFGGAFFSNATDELLATSYNGDRLRFYPKQKGFARDYELLKKQLPDGDVRIISATRDDKRVLAAVSSDVEPAAVYFFDRPSKKVELLYRARPRLPTQDLATVKPIRYRARDGLMIPAYLTLPKNVEPKNLAAVMYIHGGPWGRDIWGYEPQVQFMANRGLAVLQVNYRSSSGYGKRFLNAGNREWGTGAMQHDVSDGVKWLVDQGIADPHKVMITGGSYGGYATLAGLAFTPELYVAGVDVVGPSNLITLINSFPPYWGPLKKIWLLRVGNPEVPSDANRLRGQSPLFSANQIRAPLLIIQGKNDPRVTKAESDQIVVAMRELGLPVEYLVAPDEGHGYRVRENRLAQFVETERFIAKHLGTRVQEGVPEDIRKRLAAITVDVTTVKKPALAADRASAPKTTP